MCIKGAFLSAIVLLAAAASCSSADPANIGNVEWDPDRWEISSRHLVQGAYQSRMSLANGYLGISVAALGPFFEVDYGNDTNGWPLFNKRQTFATIAGFYDANDHDGGTNFPWLAQYGGDSFLSGIPHWAGLLVTSDGAVLDASTSAANVKNFETKLNMREGIQKWEFDWYPRLQATGFGSETLDEPPFIKVEYEMFAHKLHINQGVVQLRLYSDYDLEVTVHDVIDGGGALRTNPVEESYEKGEPIILSAVSPKNLANVTAYVASTLRCDQFEELRTRSRSNLAHGVQSSIGQSVDAKLVSGQWKAFTKFVGVASSDAFTDPKQTAIEASQSGAHTGFAALRRSHAEEWKTIMTEDSVDRYIFANGSQTSDPRPQELVLSSVMNPFMLLQNTIGPKAIESASYNPNLNKHSIPVCGLGSDCYGGMVLWDAEIFMGLGLQLSHPHHVENVINYRVATYPQAKENVKSAFTSSKNQTGRFTGGAVYPWTSGRHGNCTASGPCFDYEYHLNGDIAIAFRNQFIATGNVQQFKDVLLPISNDIAYFYSELVDYNETSGFYELWNATDPDEYANNVDNVGFTTALIQKTLNETNLLNAQFGLPQNETWNEIARKMRLPVHEKSGVVMEYASMNGSVTVKQADIVLIDDILNYDNPYSLTDLDFYANKASPDGPGMTYATFGIVANEISPSGCSSYTYHHYSGQPYARAPWFQHSEQTIDPPSDNGGTHSAFPFLTGMGGANRVALFGYLGLRMFVDYLDIDPSLPPQITFIDYRTFYWQGYGINASSNATHTDLRRMPDRILDTANVAFKDNIPVSLGTRKMTYELNRDNVVTVPNRMLGQKPTVAGNILQCKPVFVPHANSSLSAPVPGQFPLAAVDGASSTKWQPLNATDMHYITVDTESDSFAPIQYVYFDWAENPPIYFEVLTSNASLSPFELQNGDVRNVTSGVVEITQPWDPEKALEIRSIVGNQTNVTVYERVWSGRYVHLGMWGNQGKDNETKGGTVSGGGWDASMACEAEDSGTRREPREGGGCMAKCAPIRVPYQGDEGMPAAAPWMAKTPPPLWIYSCRALSWGEVRKAPEVWRRMMTRKWERREGVNVASASSLGVMVKSAVWRRALVRAVMPVKMEAWRYPAVLLKMRAGWSGVVVMVRR
ncbi:hypothetical protein BU23DRAFT_577438 [Bimuria novae-zelandiae CBS 107.79]|uniref:alpha,alpha-trehalase n=1 Tax=Bimuria novae-zelandiae CBS 107.79 TaxID=1447943 RepID=A0A6A5VPZ0_9PLEO|nr:hypothetical protein BU23DRAFT_577438 [Bimuria novae-zelandiae CBS 107.79]